VTTPISGRVCRHRLGLAMINMHTKSEVSTNTSNKDMKGNAKCKNSRFEPPFRGLRSNVQGSSMARWKARCALMAESLLSEICQNRRFLEGWVTLSANFR